MKKVLPDQGFLNGVVGNYKTWSKPRTSWVYGLHLIKYDRLSRMYQKKNIACVFVCKLQ